MTPRVTIVAALSRNGAIGRDSRMPWHISGDLKRFKTLTLGHPVVMGRKTFGSILGAPGGPPPGRAHNGGPRGEEFYPPGGPISQ